MSHSRGRAGRSDPLLSFDTSETGAEKLSGKPIASSVRGQRCLIMGPLVMGLHVYWEVVSGSVL